MNFRTIAIALGAISVAALGATDAHAATYDFVSYIDGTAGEHAVVAPFTIPDTTNTKSLTITAHGTNFDSVAGNFEAFPYAYFDRGRAGVGVCQILSGTQCSPSSDDNVTNIDGHLEILSLAFTEDLRIDNLLFRNDGHTPIFGADKHVKIAVSHNMTSITEGAFASYLLQTGLNGTELGALLLNFSSLNLIAGDFVHIMYGDQQFYLSGLEVSAIPLPAALPLFLSGLAGLGYLRRRKRTA